MCSCRYVGAERPLWGTRKKKKISLTDVLFVLKQVLCSFGVSPLFVDLNSEGVGKISLLILGLRRKDD